MYPNSFVIALGVVGPGANIHAANENINLPFAKNLTCCLSHLLAGTALEK